MGVEDFNCVSIVIDQAVYRNQVWKFNVSLCA